MKHISRYGKYLDYQIPELQESVDSFFTSYCVEPDSLIDLICRLC